MIERVTWCVDRTNRCTFDMEHLSILDRLLGRARGILVDRIGKVGVQTQEIWYTACVIAMPVREQDMGKLNLRAGQS